MNRGIESVKHVRKRSAYRLLKGIFCNDSQKRSLPSRTLKVTQAHVHHLRRLTINNFSSPCSSLHKKLLQDIIDILTNDYKTTKQ